MPNLACIYILTVSTEEHRRAPRDLDSGSRSHGFPSTFLFGIKYLKYPYIKLKIKIKKIASCQPWNDITASQGNTEKASMNKHIEPGCHLGSAPADASHGIFGMARLYLYMLRD